VSESGRPSPAFDNPPVIETLLGVQFIPLKLSVVHLGLFWARVREMYPLYRIQPPLSVAVEDFESGPRNINVELKTLAEPPIRCWFITEDEAHLIQVQRDRFIRNWRKRSPNDVYPHYDSLKPKFEFDWERFCNFVSEIGGESPEVNQCEVTYINHIKFSEEWGSFPETHKVIKLLSETFQAEFLPEPELTEMSTSYRMPNKKGRLRVSLQPIFSAPLQGEALQVTLTARGKPDSSNLADVLEWFDLGHEWIVRGFADITTPGMHRVWRRTS
jgi:uncharacterized protein (TIGR04255 family)